jgi:DNA polymerase III epsilon subunit-like protein
LNVVRKICFDVESSGLSPANGDRVIEIGAVAVRDGKPADCRMHRALGDARLLARI